jgi:RNA polymerase sigma factor (sigma-70 family)
VPPLSPEEAYAKYGDDLTRFATALVAPWDAADVVSAVMVRVLDANVWVRVDRPKPYLFRAVVNEVRSNHRSTLRRRAREERVAERDSVDPPEVAPEVLEEIAKLSVRQRAVIFLTYWHDLDQPTIARVLQISEGSVRRHLARAHHRLRGMIRHD